ncbi:MAG: molecular chaperone DnaJ [Gammaproteobacteria bacterium HGW-Gammaproteobacteria-3]|jgi:curved DNA-binding protein CbpA|nr:MAG: molecular chaperone DnaJ [Gammaproteobacteria bacterium HGW-Gammaproteobacteria-3]
MKTPYEILDVAAHADDSEIKRAYLQKVKDYPPDREPRQFQAIRQAYEAIKDRKSRMSHDLFTLPAIDFDTLLDQALADAQLKPLNDKQFNALLRASLEDKTFVNGSAPVDPS